MIEQHLIIDWSNAFTHRDMLKHIENAGLHFQSSITVPVLKNKVDTITNFYNVGCIVDDERGSTDFIVYLVTSPVCYDYRETTKGTRLVNTNMFDLKIALRKKVKSQIHATDNIQETKDNLKTLGLYEKYYKRKEFKSISEVFDVLNESKGFEYVIMRNFEGIPGDITIDEHLDVDLLVNDYYMAKCILDASCVINPPGGGSRYEDGGYRILNSVRIGGHEVWFDLRYLGDNYYDINLEKEILNKRIPCKNFYIPRANTYKHSLIYHALVHKPKISETYKKLFTKLGVSTKKGELKAVLDEYMDWKKFKYTIPTDKSVGFNILLPGQGYSSKILIDIVNKTVKKQFDVGWWKQYPNLIHREVYWLKKMEQFDRTPNLISYDYDKHVCEMSYMGEPLTKENIPSDYKIQIQYIIETLKKFKCCHNDIKPSELLVMDGKINIIDFAWATKTDEPIPIHWPENLGGDLFRLGIHTFNDAHSLEKSIHQIWV
jgi:hypothetical protein